LILAELTMSFLLYLALLLGQAPEDSSAPGTPDAAAPAENVAPAEEGEGTETPDVDEAGTVPDGGTDSGEENDTEESGDSDFMIMLMEILNSGALGLLIQGGWFMAPILLMGIIAAGVIIERFRSLKMLTVDSGAIRDEVLTLLREDRIEEAMTLCDREQGPVPAILAAGLRKFLVMRRLNYDPAKTEEQVLKAMDDYGVHVVAALEKHLPVLATVSSVAPMLGFLGTVAGMITSFEDIVEKMGETNIVESAATGISVALLTTAFGLIIGIPAFMAFNYFSSIINRFVLEIEESATELIEAVTLQIALERAGSEDS
jgi:biopolymer transport protein ExbB